MHANRTTGINPIRSVMISPLERFAYVQENDDTGDASRLPVAASQTQRQ
jgi:hypothetical protein